MEKGVVFKWDFLTYLYHNNDFFYFVAKHDTNTLPFILILTFVCFFQGWYIPMLISSILLLVFNTFFLFELPFRLSQITSDNAYTFWFHFICVVIGIWGLIRSIKEVKTMVLDNDRVISSNTYMVEGGAGREQWVLSETEKLIIESHMPGVKTEQKDVSPGMFGEKRKFLVVTHARYKQYVMFISARSFGEHLDASWFLTVEPSFFKRMVSTHATGNPTALSQKIDVFSQQDVRAFETVSSECFKKVLNTLHEELQLDPSALNSDNKGFLNAW
jgi:hypothetical protein